MKDKKKYPLIKAIFKPKERFECVYAGPPNKLSPFEGVYAGPGRVPKMGRVDAGPAPDPAEFEDVYAGPEYFERGSDSPEEENAETEPEPADEARSPEEEKPAPSDAPFMLVYAGPDYFANRGAKGTAFTGFAIPVPEEPSSFCERCGMPVPETAKFCGNCGTPLTKKV